MKVIIIGAGVAGLSIGWRLAEAGADVTVLERARAGRAATWAAAGMLAAGAESVDAPPAEAALCRASAAMWESFAAEIEAKSEQRIYYRRDGALILALTKDEAETLRRRGQFIGAEEARAMEPLIGANIEGALWDPNEAQVDNRALVPALGRCFVQAGGKISTNESAIRFEMEGERAVAVRTQFHHREADAFVIAAGAWSSQIEGLPPLPKIDPVKGEMISLAPDHASQIPARLIWGNEVYLVPRHDRLLVGATADDAGFDTGVSTRARDWLYEHACGLIPALKQWEIADQWAGLRPRAEDGLPVLGKTGADNVFVASGQFRNGILFAPMIAQTMRSLILEQKTPPEISKFDPLRFAAR